MRAAAAVWLFFPWLKLLKPKIWSLKRKINTKQRLHILITLCSSYFPHLLLEQIDSLVYSGLSFWITKTEPKESRKVVSSVVEMEKFNCTLLGVHRFSCTYNFSASQLVSKHLEIKADWNVLILVYFHL